MHTTRSQLFGFLTIAAWLLSACNLPINNATAEIASPTQPSTLTATTTPTEMIPTETPSVTATETATPEPSATLTPEPAIAKVVRKSNCRVGPGGLYDLVAAYPVGQILEVVAKDLGGGYWFVRNPKKPDEQCYLLGQNITITGETTALPKFTPQPSPTAAPYFNLAFKKFDTCEGEKYALFTIENVGSTPFRSVYIKVTELKKNISVERAYNAFDLRVKCVLAKNIAPLNPGASGYVYSPQFKWSGEGDKLRAVIMACTEKNLKGTCVTQTADIKK